MSGDGATVAEHETVLPFDRSEYLHRLEIVRAEMAAKDLDTILVSGPENICYLSGFHTTGYHVPQWLVVPAASDPHFVLRELEQSNVFARSWIHDLQVVADGEDSTDILIRSLRERDLARGRIGYEAAGPYPAPATVERLRAVTGVEWQASSGIVETPRAVKSPAELEYIRRAAAIADAALTAGVAAADGAATDSDVAAAVYAALVRGGSEYTGSPPYVVAGPDSAIAHATYAGRALRPDEHVWLEVAASVNRYHAMVGRVGVTGTPPAEIARLMPIAAEALEAMIDAVRPGATSGEVDDAGRAVVRTAGYGEFWTHRGGYSMGLSFPPGLGEGHIIDIKPNDPRELLAGMAFAFIPGISVPGVGEVGCFETVIVGERGAERLSSLERALVSSAAL